MTNPILSNLQSFVSHITSLVPVKMNGSNYDIWKFFVTNALTSAEVFDIVDGSKPCPNEFLDPNPSNQSEQNPRFSEWIKIDQFIKTALVATIEPTLIHLVSGYPRSSQIWISLERRYTHLSVSQLHHLRLQLDDVNKGTLTMEAYLDKIKSLSDALALANSPIPDRELVLITLKGLSPEFTYLKSTVRARSEPFTMDELRSFLITEEIHHIADSKIISAPSSSTTTAYQAHHDNNSHSIQAQYTHSPFPGYNRGRFNFQRGSYHQRGGRGGFHQPRGGYSQQSRGGHYSPRGGFSPSRGNFNQPRGGFNQSRGTGNFSAAPGSYCLVCGRSNHTTEACYYQAKPWNSPSNQNYAYTASASNEPDDSWNLDSGANQHVTNDFSRLNLNHHSYHGSDNITVGNGHHIPINHTGSGSPYQETSLQGPMY